MTTELEEKFNELMRLKADQYREHVGPEEVEQTLAWGRECVEKHAEEIRQVSADAAIGFLIHPVIAIKAIFASGYCMGRQDALEADLKNKINFEELEDPYD